jgi:5S rRNA maturation endonuclease (ribonuclease M5)
MPNLDALPLSGKDRAELQAAWQQLERQARQIRQDLTERYRRRYQEQLQSEGRAADSPLSPVERDGQAPEGFEDELRQQIEQGFEELHAHWRQLLASHLPPGTLGDHPGPDFWALTENVAATGDAPGSSTAPLVQTASTAEAPPPALPPIDLAPLLVRDAARFPADVQAYREAQPHWFTDPAQLLREWGVGYLPEGADVPQALKDLAGTLVFPLRDRFGEVLGYAGRDPAFEERLRSWKGLADVPPPVEWRWALRPAGALFGQDRVAQRGSKKKLKEAGGVLVVEEPGDVIRLARVGVLAVALLGRQATPEQLAALEALAQEYAEGRLQLMLDLDTAGRQAMQELMYQVHLRTKTWLRVAWTSKTLGGKFAGKKPSQLADEELAAWRGQL